MVEHGHIPSWVPWANSFARVSGITTGKLPLAHAIYEAAFVKPPVQGICEGSSRTFPLAVGVGRPAHLSRGPRLVDTSHSARP